MIYLITWWLIFFITLPIGVKKGINVKYGNDPGAPDNANIKKKAIVTTVITFFLTLIIILIKNEIL